ncbi:MAG: metal-dependent hydrolase [Actinomycetota bacterium]|nr:metal-dependent hydrolase [Actinomycetota bacterium]MDD5667121.1 metal-dependent hydrolase [Actinomycetota bacterium]
MFFVAHLGFAAAPAAMVSGWWGENRGFADKAPDLRWLLAGAVLPDIVDKAIGQLFFKPYFENGRIFAHTLVVVLALFVVGTCEWKRRGDNRILLLACGVAAHLVLDRIWTEPATAYWPALGPFKKNPSMGTLLDQIREYLRDPAFWATELAGAAVLVASLRYLGIGNAGALRAFLAHGTSPTLSQYELRHWGQAPPRA